MGGSGEGFAGANRKSSGLVPNSNSSSQLSSRTCRRRGVDNSGFRGEVFRIFNSKSSSRFSMFRGNASWVVVGIRRLG